MASMLLVYPIASSERIAAVTALDCFLEATKRCFGGSSMSAIRQPVIVKPARYRAWAVRRQH